MAGRLDSSAGRFDASGGAKSPKLRSKLVELIHTLESDYELALKSGRPAYDPSWMWSELGLDGDLAPDRPPPLAHERIAERVPGAAELSRKVAESERLKPGFSDRSTVLSDEDSRQHLELRRFLREREGAIASNDDRLPAWDGSALAPHLELMVNFDLHRRKAFWVDESLAFLLARTELDVNGAELRAPFPSFALVFTDRHVLSLAERLLARDRGCPLAGHLLKIATVYVTEHHEEQRRLRFTFALDALGADAPALVSYEIRIDDEGKVEAELERLSPAVVTEPATIGVNPIRGLLTVAVNAILYATSVGVEPQVRAPRGQEHRPRTEPSRLAVFTCRIAFLSPQNMRTSRPAWSFARACLAK